MSTFLAKGPEGLLLWIGTAFFSQPCLCALLCSSPTYAEEYDINSSFWEAINTVSSSKLFLSFSWWVGRRFPICFFIQGTFFLSVTVWSRLHVTCDTRHRSVALTSAHLTQTWITRAVMSWCLTFVWSLIDLFILICYQRIFSFLWTQYLECFLISLKHKTLRCEQASFVVSFILCLLPSTAPLTVLHIWSTSGLCPVSSSYSTLHLWVMTLNHNLLLSLYRWNLCWEFSPVIYLVYCIESSLWREAGP